MQKKQIYHHKHNKTKEKSKTKIILIITATIIAIAIKHPGLLEFELDFDGVPYEREGTFRPSESTSC